MTQINETRAVARLIHEELFWAGWVLILCFLATLIGIFLVYIEAWWLLGFVTFCLLVGYGLIFWSLSSAAQYSDDL